MLDIQLLRNDLQGVAARLAARGVTLDTAAFERLEAKRKTVQTQTQELQAKRNQLSKQVGQAKGKGEDASALMAEVNAQASRTCRMRACPSENRRVKIRNFAKSARRASTASR